MSDNTCPDCTAAAQARHHGFRAGCRGCCARSISRSPQFFAARKVGGVAGNETRAYRLLLEQIGGLLTPAVTHEDVKAASAADAISREKVAA